MNIPKIVRPLAVIGGALLLSGSLAAHEKGKHGTEPAPASSPAAVTLDASDVAAVRQVLSTYKAGLEALDVSGLTGLFTADSEIFESGGVEGSFARYLEHHIGPELDEFKAFSFRDYAVNVRIEGDYAFATETYIYRIVLKEDGRVIEKRGLATSVLKRTPDGWKIRLNHSSSRNLPKPN